MSTAVRIENVGKRYRIGGLHPGYMTLREALGGAILAPFKRRGSTERSREMWALDGVSMEVGEGELVGVIGRNGAGKSTLLKILSRITKPTRGRVTLRGRVGSLLEVGTGFHPDLTGRENVYLSGAILGMRRAEIARKFDEIVAFSEIEKFIDTPVKWYSSGMYVRLAFSVAAHLEPEILMMDEVLAVGDAAFQQKCLDKMSDIRREGRTILFVSHNMPAVVRLCRRVVLLREGRIISDGQAQSVVNQYLSSSWTVGAERVWEQTEEAPGDSVVRLRRVRVRAEEGETAASFDVRRAVAIEITFDVTCAGQNITPHIELQNEEGAQIFSAHDTGADAQRERAKGLHISTVWIPGNFLAEGHLLAHVSLVSHKPATVLRAHAPRAVAFQLIDPGHDTDNAMSARGDFEGPMPGVVRPLLKWQTNFEGGGAKSIKPGHSSNSA